MEENKSKGEKNSVMGMIVIAAFVIFFLGLGGQSSRLTCKHARGSSLTNCVNQAKLLWVIPLGNHSINSVIGAQLGSSDDYEGGSTYRVELRTAQGIVPLTAVYTSGYSTKREVVDQINAYVQTTDPTPLELTEPGMLSGENFFCMLIWLPIAYLLSKVRGGIKSLFSR
jgi:hypothetical protein